MILGHAALAVLGKRTVFRVVPLPILMIATYAPDLIDKTGMLFLGTSSKNLGHALITFVGISVILAVALAPIRSNKLNTLWVSTVVLWIMHLFLDLTDKSILLWPLIGPFPSTDTYDLSEGFIEFYSGHGNNLVLTFDITCIIVAFIVLIWPRRPKQSNAL